MDFSLQSGLANEPQILGFIPLRKCPPLASGLASVPHLGPWMQQGDVA